MRTLYLSGLDGTLLRSDQTISAFTARTINELVKQGMFFSYATARSYITASRVTAGMNAHIPLVLYNGAFILDSTTQKVLFSNIFQQSQAQELLDCLRSREIWPIVYSMQGGKERFSYLLGQMTDGVRTFVQSRKGDVRDHPVQREEQLREGDIFYFTCIDEEQKLRPIYEHYREQLHCVFQKDLYTGDQWLEIMPMFASKSHAAQQLKELLCCERLVVFGDGRNDLDLFEIADECYATQNADPALKEIATGIIGSNDADSVALWLQEHAEFEK